LQHPFTNPLLVYEIVIFSLEMQNLSLYFHIPFCRRRCGYCDFNTFAGMNQYISDYVNVLCREVESVFTTAPDQFVVHSVFFGGGTPSLLSTGHFEKILDITRKQVRLSNDVELTLEANPETVTKQSIADLFTLGFNRISFGMQSASKRDLKILDRQHDFKSILNALQWSRQAGFRHLNLDLIFGIPGQDVESWQRTLKTALELGVDHFSLYSLTLEDGTRLKKWVDRGILEGVDDDLVADMYALAIDLMENSGYIQYEISNFARGATSVSRHNLQYWRYLPYLGFGAGAHGFYGNTRTENVSLIPEYLQSIQNHERRNFPASPATKNVIRLSKWERIQENLMVSLRLTQEGVSIMDLNEQYQIQINDLFGPQISRLVRLGLLEYFAKGERMRLTRRGRFLGNRVFLEFIDNPVPEYFDL